MPKAATCNAIRTKVHLSAKTSLSEKAQKLGSASCLARDVPLRQMLTSLSIDYLIMVGIIKPMKLDPDGLTMEDSTKLAMQEVN